MFQELMNKKAIKKRIHRNRKSLIAGLVAIGVAVVIGVLCLAIALLMNARSAKKAAAAAIPTPTPTPVVTTAPVSTDNADQANAAETDAEAAESEGADAAETSPAPTAAPVSTVKVGPTITKSPYDEKVTSGGTVVFVAHAKNYKKVEWRLVSEDTYTSYDMETASKLYGFWYTGADTESITMGSVLISLDGWKVQACFTDKEGNSSYTDFAQLHVVRPAW